MFGRSMFRTGSMHDLHRYADATRKAKPLVARGEDSQHVRIRCAPIALDLDFDAQSPARAPAFQLIHGASR